MADTFRIYKGTEVVVEGVSPLAITGVAPNTDVTSGTYQAVRLEGDRESDKVDIPTFKTLPIGVSEISLNKTTLTLEIGISEKLLATIKPDDATNKNITWSTGNSTLATVDLEGNIKAIKSGNVRITATTVDGEKKANCEVTVVEPAPEG